MERKAGVLMHISSLPSNYGIGTLGAEAYHFVDFFAAAFGLVLYFIIGDIITLIFFPDVFEFHLTHLL